MVTNALILVSYGDGLDDLLEIRYESFDTFIDLGIYLKKEVLVQTSNKSGRFQIKAVIAEGVHLPITQISDAHIFLKTIHESPAPALPRFYMEVRNIVKNVEEAIDLYFMSFESIYLTDDDFFKDMINLHFPRVESDLIPFINKDKFIEHYRSFYLRIGTYYFNRKFLGSIN